MKKTIKIDNPCSESWQKMKPTKDGRFCSTCLEQVYDLDNLTKREILLLFKKNKGQLCGHISINQLNKLNANLNQNDEIWILKTFKKISASLILVLSFLGFPSKKALFAKPLLSIENNSFCTTDINQNYPPTDSNRVLTIKITDTNGNPLPNAYLYVRNGFMKTLSIEDVNKEGEAKITLSQDSKYLEINASGKLTIKYTIKPESYSIIFKMEENHNPAQDVIYIGGYMNLTNKQNRDTITKKSIKENLK